MILSVRAQPFLTLILLAVLFGGCVMIGNNDLALDDDKSNQNLTTDFIIATALLPDTLPILIASILILIIVKPLELVISSLKTLIGISITAFIDLSTRCLLWGFYDFHPAATGPLAINIYLSLIFFLMFPNVYSSLIRIKEKHLLLAALIFVSLLSGLTSLIAIISALISFTLTSPLILYVAKTKAE